MIISSKIKKQILDLLENKINEFSLNSGISKKEFGLIIRKVHYLIFIIPLFTVLFVNKILILLHIVILLIIISLFIFFNGCILSVLEYRLCKDNFTVVDPYLNLLFVEVNNETRKKYTLLSLLVMLCYFIFVYNIKK